MKLRTELLATDGEHIKAEAFVWRKKYPLTDEEMDYVRANFKYVNYKDLSDIDDPDYYWKMCWRKGTDEKYGRYMVSFHKKIYRGQTMGEFYGGGTVD